MSQVVPINVLSMPLVQVVPAKAGRPTKRKAAPFANTFKFPQSRCFSSLMASLPRTPKIEPLRKKGRALFDFQPFESSGLPRLRPTQITTIGDGSHFNPPR